MNLSIHLSDPLISKLDAYAAALAKSRSSYCHWPLRPPDRGHRAGTRRNTRHQQCSRIRAAAGFGGGGLVELVARRRRVR